MNGTEIERLSLAGDFIVVPQVLEAVGYRRESKAGNRSAQDKFKIQFLKVLQNSTGDSLVALRKKVQLETTPRNDDDGLDFTKSFSSLNRALL
jgi:hypothetical protein